MIQEEWKSDKTEWRSFDVLMIRENEPELEAVTLTDWCTYAKYNLPSCCIDS